MPSKAHLGCRGADQRADDLAHGKEDAVEAHDRAAIGREGLGHVRQQPQGGRRGASEQEHADREPSQPWQTHDSRIVARVVQQERRDDEDRPADDAVEDDGGATQRLETAAPVEQPEQEDGPTRDEGERHEQRVEAAHEPLVLEASVGLRTSWNSVCEVYRPRPALSAIQVGASSHTRERRSKRR